MVSAFIRNVAVAVLLLVAQSFGALADKRVALVIGNSAYQNVPGLPNPINDATAIAELLRNAGFDVVDSRADLGIAVIRAPFASSRTSHATPISRSSITLDTASRWTAPTI
jgi:Caspase domain